MQGPGVVEAVMESYVMYVVYGGVVEAPTALTPKSTHPYIPNIQGIALQNGLAQILQRAGRVVRVAVAPRAGCRAAAAAAYTAGPLYRVGTIALVSWFGVETQINQPTNHPVPASDDGDAHDGAAAATCS